MIIIITGKIDAGKTTRLLSLYDHLKTGDGFALKKIITNGIHIGQEIYHLSTGQQKIFSLKKNYLPPLWDEIYNFGDFSFSAAGFDFSHKILLKALSSGVKPIYIDEIGPLELLGKGFSDALKLVVKNQTDLYLTVRDYCLTEVIKEFNINRYVVIEVR
ncbi:MAG: nucleoside-triphosphatase [Desulfitobacteriaceae bacterium]|nr:nucleoside-triphosphatase [Desulfitobacteriaceae bacterium]